jgi:hypothetical protein
MLVSVASTVGLDQVRKLYIYIPYFPLVCVLYAISYLFHTKAQSHHGCEVAFSLFVTPKTERPVNIRLQSNCLQGEMKALIG